MTELTISSEEIRSAISSYVSSLETDTSREEVGTVTDTADGTASFGANLLGAMLGAPVAGLTAVTGGLPVNPVERVRRT